MILLWKCNIFSNQLKPVIFFNNKNYNHETQNCFKTTIMLLPNGSYNSKSIKPKAGRELAATKRPLNTASLFSIVEH